MQTMNLIYAFVWVITKHDTLQIHKHEFVGKKGEKKRKSLIERVVKKRDNLIDK